MLPGRLGKRFLMHRDRDSLLQLIFINEEILVSASHQLVLTTSLPFVHTARRSYRLNGPVNNSDCCSGQPLSATAGSLVSLTT